MEVGNCTYRTHLFLYGVLKKQHFVFLYDIFPDAKSENLGGFTKKYVVYCKYPVLRVICCDVHELSHKKHRGFVGKT